MRLIFLAILLSSGITFPGTAGEITKLPEGVYFYHISPFTPGQSRTTKKIALLPGAEFDIHPGAMPLEGIESVSYTRSPDGEENLKVILNDLGITFLRSRFNTAPLILGLFFDDEIFSAAEVSIIETGDAQKILHFPGPFDSDTAAGYDPWKDPSEVNKTKVPPIRISPESESTPKPAPDRESLFQRIFRTPKR